MPTTEVASPSQPPNREDTIAHSDGREKQDGTFMRCESFFVGNVQLPESHQTHSVSRVWSHLDSQRTFWKGQEQNTEVYMEYFRIDVPCYYNFDELIVKWFG